MEKESLQWRETNKLNISRNDRSLSADPNNALANEQDANEKSKDRSKNDNIFCNVHDSKKFEKKHPNIKEDSTLFIENTVSEVDNCDKSIKIDSIFSQKQINTNTDNQSLKDTKNDYGCTFEVPQRNLSETNNLKNQRMDNAGEKPISKILPPVPSQIVSKSQNFVESSESLTATQKVKESSQEPNAKIYDNNYCDSNKLPESDAYYPSAEILASCSSDFVKSTSFDEPIFEGNQSLQSSILPNKDFLSDRIDREYETNSVPKSLWCQNSFVPHLLSSDALNYETDIELKKLESLSSLQANRSIYKLAYDETLTDQSETDSRSPSPDNPSPESQVPSSLTRAEILIHEADSGSDAGSEDVELLPHRYESETFRNESKHVYVNRLSLAVELLRTHETLPYDEEFKRVVADNNNTVRSGNIGDLSEVNFAFIDDAGSPTQVRAFNEAKYVDNRALPTVKAADVTNHSYRHSRISAADSGVQSEDSGDEICEEACAKAPRNESENHRNTTDEVNAGYRRFGVHAQHRLNFFTPRAALVNPCLCCVIM